MLNVLGLINLQYNTIQLITFSMARSRGLVVKVDGSQSSVLFLKKNNNNIRNDRKK